MNPSSSAEDYQWSDAHTYSDAIWPLSSSSLLRSTTDGNYLTSDSGGYETFRRPGHAGQHVSARTEYRHSLPSGSESNVCSASDVGTSSARALGVNQYSYPLSGGADGDFDYKQAADLFLELLPVLESPTATRQLKTSA